MKTYIKVFVFVTATLAFVSCDDKDNDLKGGPVDTSRLDSPSLITTFNAEQVLLASIDDGTFHYNADGFPIESDGCLIDYGKGIIDNSDSDDVEVYTFKLNTQGYISSMVANVKFAGGSYKASYSMSYNSDGLLTKIAASGSSKEKEEGYLCTETFSGEITISYQGKRITQSSISFEYKWDEIEDGEKDTGWEKYSELNLVEEATENYLNQHSYSLCNLVDGFSELYIVGMFGVAPSNLPTAIYQSYKSSYTDSYDQDSYSDAYNYKCSYDFNADGTIAVESHKYENNTDTYVYAYKPFERGRGFNDEQVYVASEFKKEFKKDNLFGLPLHRRHHRK